MNRKEEGNRAHEIFTHHKTKKINRYLKSHDTNEKEFKNRRELYQTIRKQFNPGYSPDPEQRKITKGKGKIETYDGFLNMIHKEGMNGKLRGNLKVFIAKENNVNTKNIIPSENYLEWQEEEEYIIENDKFIRTNACLDEF
jgi:hypothetical protein